MSFILKTENCGVSQPAKHKAVCVTAVINSCQEQRSCYIARSKLSFDGESPLVLLLGRKQIWRRTEDPARSTYAIFSFLPFGRHHRRVFCFINL